MKKIGLRIKENILKIIIILTILIACGYIFYPFLPAIFMGAVLALALSPTKSYLESRKLSPRRALLVMMSGIVLLVFVPTMAFFIRGSRMVNSYLQNTAFMEQLKELQLKLTSYINDFLPLIGLQPDEFNQHVQTVVQNAGTYFLSHFGSIIGEIPGISLFFIIMVIALYVFLDNELKIRYVFNRHINLTLVESDHIIRVLKASSTMVFFSNVLTGLLQATFVTIGSLIFGVGDWFMVYFVTFIFSFIPVLGAGPVAFVLALYSFMNGNTMAGIGLSVFAVIAGAIDNIARPFLVTNDEVEVPALVSLLAVIGGVGVFGLKGLFLGPFMTAVAFGVLPILIEDQFGDEASEQTKSDM